VQSKQEFRVARGDHIVVRRRGYTHHGVDIGSGMVVHFNGEPGSKAGATIRHAKLMEFTGPGRIETRTYAVSLPPDEVVARAESKLGQSGYNLFNNNCEHFARWCVTGRAESGQVVTAAAAVGGVGVVSTAGSVSGLSAAGIMSGLAAVGPAGVVGGLVTVGTLPGVASAAIMQAALKDDAALPVDERKARRIGRRASVAGAAAGSLGGIAAVSAAGAVPGLSAAGITSGLAAIGGSMAIGTSVVVAGPAVAAAGLGFVAYRAARRWKGVRSPRANSPDEKPVIGGTDSGPI
jgi:hypothetical protein